MARKLRQPLGRLRFSLGSPKNQKRTRARTGVDATEGGRDEAHVHYPSRQFISCGRHFGGGRAACDDDRPGTHGQIEGHHPGRVVDGRERRWRIHGLRFRANSKSAEYLIRIQTNIVGLADSVGSGARTALATAANTATDGRRVRGL